MPIMDENDVSLPKATLSKMIREFMPSDLRLAGDTMDMLIECCTEFVSLVSSESNEVSTKEKRNTIHPEHVLRALSELGFQEFVKDVQSTWDSWKEDNKCAHKPGGKKTAADVAGLTEEEQIALQQKLFAQARRSFQLPDSNTTTGNPGTSFQPPPQGPQLPYQQPQPSSYYPPPGPTPPGQLSNFPAPPGHINQPPQQPQLLPHTSQHTQHLQNPSPPPPGAYFYNQQGLQRSAPSTTSAHGPGPGVMTSDYASLAARSDVLPIYPLQPQPQQHQLPSRFQSASSGLGVGVGMAGPSVLPDVRSVGQMHRQGEGGGIPGASQPLLMVRPGTGTGTGTGPGPGPASTQAGECGTVPHQSPTSHTQQAFQLDLQMNHPVMIVHNGVQHYVPLQTLLAQVAQFPQMCGDGQTGGGSFPVVLGSQVDSLSMPLQPTQPMQLMQLPVVSHGQVVHKVEGDSVGREPGPVPGPGIEIRQANQPLPGVLNFSSGEASGQGIVGGGPQQSADDQCQVVRPVPVRSQRLAGVPVFAAGGGEEKIALSNSGFGLYDASKGGQTVVKQEGKREEVGVRTGPEVDMGTVDVGVDEGAGVQEPSLKKMRIEPSVVNDNGRTVEGDERKPDASERVQQQQQQQEQGQGQEQQQQSVQREAAQSEES